MDCSISSPLGVNNSAATSASTANFTVQGAPVASFLTSDKSSTADKTADKTGLLERSLTANPGESKQIVPDKADVDKTDVDKTGIDKKVHVSGCVLSLTEGNYNNIKKLRLVELPSLKDDIGMLDASRAKMPLPLVQRLMVFTNDILQLELPLCRHEIHLLLAHTRHIIELCSGPNEPDLSAIKSSLKKIECLYPAFLESHHPGVFQLADLLLTNGFIKYEESRLVSNYGVKTFVFKLVRHLPTLPVSQFIQHTQPLLGNAEFLQLLTSDPALFFANGSDDYFQYWLTMIELHYPHSLSKLTDKIFAAIGRWYELPEAFFIHNFARFKQIVTAEFDKRCKVAAAEFDYQLQDSSCLMLVLHRLCTMPKLLTPLNDLLVDYFAALNERQRQFFSVLFLVDVPDLFEQLLNTSIGQSLLQSVSCWRSGSNETAFHCGLGDRFVFKAISSGLLTRVAERYPAILSTRDNNGKTVLESFFYALDHAGKRFDNTNLKHLVTRTADGGIEPCHVLALLDQVVSLNGHHAALALHILANPRVILGGLPAIATVPLGSVFAEEFRLIALCAQDCVKEADLLKRLQLLPFGSAARIAIARQFPIYLRAWLFADPFSHSNRPIWESEVVPFVDESVSPGSSLMVELPWSDLLLEAKVCFSPPTNATLLQQWRQYQDIPATAGLPPFVRTLPTGSCGIYGRSCYFHDPDNGTTLRFKLRKKMIGDVPEPWEELASEPGKLRCLRAWQTAGTLALQTRFPEPLGLFRIRHFRMWLLESRLDQQQREALRESVVIEADGSVLAYAYQTKIQEHYHRYPYETEGEGLSVAQSLASLQVAANDLGMLLGCGLASTMLPMYHAEQRFFVLLSQLINCPCPGTLGSWNSDASNYPNVSPTVGIRDYAGIVPLAEMPINLERNAKDTPDNRQIMGMEQIAREYFSLIILLPRVLAREMDYQNPDFVVRLQGIINKMSCTFFAGAFGLAEERISECLETFGVTGELARVISFWCETGEHPAWVDHYRAALLPTEVYSGSAPLPMHFPNDHVNTLTDRGFCKTTHSKGLNLGAPNGIFPLLPLNKLLTMVFNLYVHKDTARS